MQKFRQIHWHIVEQEDITAGRGDEIVFRYISLELKNERWSCAEVPPDPLAHCRAEDIGTGIDADILILMPGYFHSHGLRNDMKTI